MAAVAVEQAAVTAVVVVLEREAEEVILELVMVVEEKLEVVHAVGVVDAVNAVEVKSTCQLLLSHRCLSVLLG